MEIIIKYEGDAEFFDRSLFRYYAAGLSARRVTDGAVAVTGVSLRVSKTEDEHQDDKIAYDGSMRMAKSIFPSEHFYNHQAALQRIVVENFKDV